ncbi:hypothetical protein [uncultured Alistipes sp.]|jgi:hypothetical protein|uniref:hypothetical protein n=1 Tax=uncultured Alistipes sp. TaxID=538949 RepID=UPI0025F25CAC|nr:hypothetical protein [uncultured Alistipes sp.]
MKATYTKPELEIVAVTVEVGFAASQPHGGEIGPSSADYSSRGRGGYDEDFQ